MVEFLSKRAGSGLLLAKSPWKYRFPGYMADVSRWGRLMPTQPFSQYFTDRL